MDPRFFPLIYGLHTSRLGHKSTGENSVHNLQYGPQIRLVRRMYKVVLFFESVDEILKCYHSNESY